MTSPVPWPVLKRSLVAILRGIKPDETADTISALVEAGFEAIEIPLNSPDPFRSIQIAVEAAPSHCLIGAGTVLSTGDVDRLADVGATLMISPNVDPGVISYAASHKMVTMPGVFTPSEALSAIKAGASGLKFFPASVLGPSGISAIKAVLPPEIEIGAVGGVSHESYSDYRAIGVCTFGLGSSLYKPGMNVEEIAKRARLSVSAYDDVFGA
ncbi:MAG: 2-dehydro-3-deoxy-6-phosphogalactonate aldolase [Hyphomicrobiales bacterium]|nr:2-dehydro-3-deoxy-6-phosphogalactonate aldolase [Hyphomicrobiales bacterium]MCP5000858.1 2-dehydro-3-deoxy-6-phosphogalactonate aldolase [Hyphomicrobiales bacterium]